MSVRLNDADPAEVIQQIHDMGAELGFSRVRIDRSQIASVSSHKPEYWFEVGYAGKEIHVRTSHKLSYRAEVNRVDMHVVSDMLCDLLEQEPLT